MTLQFKNVKIIQRHTDLWRIPFSRILKIGWNNSDICWNGNCLNMNMQFVLVWHLSRKLKHHDPPVLPTVWAAAGLSRWWQVAPLPEETLVSSSAGDAAAALFTPSNALANYRILSTIYRNVAVAFNVIKRLQKQLQKLLRTLFSISLTKLNFIWCWPTLIQWV